MDEAILGIIRIFVSNIFVSCAVGVGAIRSIKEVKTNFKFFPRHYSMPPKWIRKLYHLKKAKIPKYLLFMLYLSVALGMLSIIFPFVYLCGGAYDLLGELFLLIPVVIGMLIVPISIVLDKVYKK